MSTAPRTLKSRVAGLLNPVALLTPDAAVALARTSQSNREIRALIRRGEPAVHAALARRVEHLSDRLLVLLGAGADDAVFALVSGEVTARQHAARRGSMRRPTH